MAIENIIPTETYVVIGNGFDIECGLPTRYTNFMMFLKAEEQLIEKGEITDNSTDLSPIIVNEMRQADATYWKPAVDSFWYKHFCQVSDTIPGGWVDFENEIRRVVVRIENSMKLVDDRLLTSEDQIMLSSFSGLDDILDPLLEQDDYEKKEYAGVEYFEFPMTYRQLAEKLYDDLAVFTSAFGKYISDYVSLIQPSITSNITDLVEKVQVGQKINVLTFNYTDTLEKVLKGKHIPANYCYLHGKIESGNLVMGIDEHLRGRSYSPFGAFCKLNQRIFKNTDNQYKLWERELEGERLAPIRHLYVFGHSFGLNDQDILRRIIMGQGMLTRIYYHDDKNYMGIVCNLNEIIGEKELDKRTGGRSPQIQFIRQA